MSNSTNFNMNMTKYDEQKNKSILIVQGLLTYDKHEK